MPFDVVKRGEGDYVVRKHGKVVAHSNTAGKAHMYTYYASQDDGEGRKKKKGKKSGSY